MKNYGGTLMHVMSAVALLFLLSGCAGVTGRGDSVATTAPGDIPWTFVDGNTDNGINRDPSKDVYFPQLTVFNSKLYATWREENWDMTAFQSRVAVYNVDDNAPAWTFVDGGGRTGINHDVNKNAFDQQLTVFESKLYAIWHESNLKDDYHVRAAVYNGNDSAPAWTYIDGNETGGLNHDPSQVAAHPQMMAVGSKLYAAWEESNGQTRQIRVAVYNGNDSAPAWTFVDGNGPNGINNNINKDAFDPQLTVFNSKIYAIWKESNGTAFQIRVAIYNGNDNEPAWTFIDEGSLNHDVTKDAAVPQLTVWGSSLYAIWEEAYKDAVNIRVAVFYGNYNSPEWLFVDGNGPTGINKNPARLAFSPQLTVFGNRLYATWYEYNHEVGQVRVAVYSNDREPSWTFVDGGGDKGLNHNAAQETFDPNLAVMGTKLYASWKEVNSKGHHQVRVAVYKKTVDPPPASPTWVERKADFVDPYTGIEFLLVKGGTFDMGDIFDDGDGWDVEEKPVHQVTLSDYYIAKCEVTQTQWEKVMGNNPSHFIGPDNPIDMVSWYDVQEYIRRLNEKTGRNYRLPTEAEWEYAARSGGKREKWAGTNNIEEIGDYAWYFPNSDRKSHPVGTKKPNGLGIHDMSGNQWEWVNDWYEIYPAEPQVNPKGPDSSSFEWRAYRGAAWDYIPRLLRTTTRSGRPPDHPRKWISFRLAADVNALSGQDK